MNLENEYLVIDLIRLTIVGRSAEREECFNTADNYNAYFTERLKDGKPRFVVGRLVLEEPSK